jgi:hypothetical protein
MACQLPVRNPVILLQGDRIELGLGRQAIKKRSQSSIFEAYSRGMADRVSAHTLPAYSDQNYKFSSIAAGC